MAKVELKLATGCWVPVCRANAERLMPRSDVRVEYKRFCGRGWVPVGQGYEYAPRMLFRAQIKK